MPEAQASVAVLVADKTQFCRLYQEHFDEVMGFVLRFGISAADAEDLVQRVFIVVLRRADLTQSIERPSAWLRAVALHVVHEHFRWWRVRRAGSWLVEQTWAGRKEDDLSPEREAMASESLQRARRVLHRMSGKLRDAFVLLDIEGLSSREAAQLLGISHNTMRSRHILARDEFKRLWKGTQSSKEKLND